MMTLYDLMNSITIQGDVKVSAFNSDGEETKMKLFRLVGDLSTEGGMEDFEDLVVTYMFVDKDGCMVIELEDED